MSQFDSLDSYDHDHASGLSPECILGSNVDASGLVEVVQAATRKNRTNDMLLRLLQEGFPGLLLFCGTTPFCAMGDQNGTKDETKMQNRPTC